MECGCDCQGYLDDRCAPRGMCGKDNTMAYDTKCYDLAEAFLEDEPSLNTEARRKALAQVIQTAIEEEIDWMRDNYEPPDSAPIGNTADDLRHQQTEAMKLK